MMKKVIVVVITLSLIVSYTILPIDASAKTISQFEAEVNKYTSELEAKKNKVAKNDKEVAQIKQKIKNIQAQIAQAEADIRRLQKEIDESNRKIKEKTAESKKIIEYYQISNGENVYLEYAFGAKSITDMVYRMSVVEQLTEYNDNIMKELDRLIKSNEQKQKSLGSKKEELKKLTKDLNSEKEKINADTAALKAAMPGLEEQIKAAKQQIRDLRNMGCGRNESVQSCTSRYYARMVPSSSSGAHSGGGGGGYTPSANGFARPMQYGYITQGYRGMAHMGVDLSSSNKTIPIYPIAVGQVSAKYYDAYGALVLKVRHNVGGRIIYSTYAHLSSWSVSVGQTVSLNTQIGRMGNTGYSTGPHLHLELTTCDWKSAGGGCTWAQYQHSTINPATYVSLPSSWTTR
ncbi:MAG: peptidoglycan DD-metalloendopeptidase family protein [Bacilli bacterium]|nr:peptidoglycan DD-metalloendopeptidase family protein [Bacilli bacterium]MBR3049751.1 peptidoglycan DD-metalloendopeptidase family protein [Bacilli bacterium]